MTNPKDLQKSSTNAIPLESATLAGDELIASDYGDINLEHKDITSESSTTLFDAMDFQRMCQADIWSTPYVSMATWQGTSWYKSFDFSIPQITDYKVELDERAVWFYEAVTSSKGMVNPVVGKGQVYMTTKRDSNGDLLRADRTYKLHVPANVPVAQFWALTLYSENTRRPYDNGGTESKNVSLDSLMKQLQFNDDGSIDLYIGAIAPEGKAANFLKTVGQDGWFVYFRLYAPTEAFFDKSFSLPDFERIDL